MLSKVLARIETETRAGALGGDVVWMADPTAFDGMVAQKQLLAYRPPEWQHIKLAKQPDGYFVAGRILVGCLLVNPRAGGAGVKSFADLTRTALKGKVAIASPLVSGSTQVIDGTLWKDPRFGWKYFDQLKKNDVLVLNDVPDVARAVACRTTTSSKNCCQTSTGSRNPGARTRPGGVSSLVADRA